MNIQKEHLSRNYKVIVIGGSAGSFQGITKILSSLPSDFSLPIVMALHRLKHVRHGFVEALSIKSKLPVHEPEDKETIRKGQVYLAPANYHLSVELGNYFSLSTEEMRHNSRPSIDITLETASYAYRQKVLGILLSGANSDGASGMKAIKDRGGVLAVQDPETCLINTMPMAALNITKVDYTLTVEEIINLLIKIHKNHL